MSTTTNRQLDSETIKRLQSLRARLDKGSKNILRMPKTEAGEFWVEVFLRKPEKSAARKYAELYLEALEWISTPETPLEKMLREGNERAALVEDDDNDDA
jgi:hypothetical protein